ncbi:hypothetical protein GWK47_039551 [Chionoecetes opilio]|uniref:Fibronectin type-III domain-containing protein n=1 Tax=Chionoecetes opilio TaxID=41210 RepID=A0A8J4YQV8_CHIOP|nr:hypothetical protein GWK47_039551 [Chionoecetes opilio]
MPPMIDYNGTSMDNRVSQATGPWDIKLHSTGSTTGPAVAPLSSGPVQYMSHAITHLEPATDYEATVAVENKFGWSSDSQIFHFYTRKGSRRGNARHLWFKNSAISSPSWAPSGKNCRTPYR